MLICLHFIWRTGLDAELGEISAGAERLFTYSSRDPLGLPIPTALTNI